MSALGQTWIAITDTMTGHPAGAFAVGLALLSLAHAALGIARARQWYVLPVAVGLTALAGFLVNPFADSSTALDLRTKLTSYETLTTLCIVQFVLTAATLALSLRIDTENQGSSLPFWLSVIHAIPAPLLVIGMLIVEQTQLAEFPGARPEPVGRQVGFLASGVLLLAVIVTYLAPRRRLALPHQLLSVAILLACMFAPLLQDSLPQAMWSLDTESLSHLWKVLLGAALVVAAGALWRPRFPSDSSKAIS